MDRRKWSKESSVDLLKATRSSLVSYDHPVRSNSIPVRETNTNKT